ncbi:MAG: DUF262 domain-containing protein [Vicinamibacterales bacterium]
MAYQTPISIKTALDRIWKHDYVLPAIQREFVWKPEQIHRLFDSLMQGFPVGSFLFWTIEPKTASTFDFFDFAREYHQRDNPHCAPLGAAPSGAVTAVLDGQQRLTALNIGLRGTLAVKEPNKWWNNPSAFPVKRLFLNLLHAPASDEQGAAYEFRFLTDEKAAERDDEHFWFAVPDIYAMAEPAAPMVYLASHQLGNNKLAVESLFRLQQVVHQLPVIAFYEENSQSIERVLNVFIRTNSGGTVLSYSDLLLSIATAQWTERDARSEINTLVDSLNEVGAGFNLSKDFVLKAGLMLSDIKSVGFKVENFSRQNMKVLEANWSRIAEALLLTVRLVSTFGLSRDTVTADSALLPIAYYLYRRGPGEGYLTSKSEAGDRMLIKSWLLRSLIKPGIWGSGLDVVLSAIRDVLQTSVANVFPSGAIEHEMRTRGKNLEFAKDELEDLLDRRYGDREVFALLTMLFPFVDTRNQFHIDHIFPRAIFHANRLKALGFSPEEVARMQDMKERLANLQLLEGSENQSKSAQMPGEWLTSLFSQDGDRQNYVSNHYLHGIDGGVSEFEAFYKARRDRLRERIAVVLNQQPSAAL